METIDYEGLTLRKWTIGASSFLACPERGARLMNWHLRLADGSFRDVIHWPEDADYSQLAKVRGGNPILFPFAGATFDQGEIGFWRDPEGERRAMPQHGFARQGTFAVDELRTDGFSAHFVADAAAQEGYPFKYTFTVEYRFAELHLDVHLTLKNEDKRAIPWSSGHHFYFTLPWHGLGQREDYRIDIPAKKAFRRLDNGQLDEIKPAPKETAFDAPELIERLHCKLKSPESVFGPKSGEEDIRVTFLPPGQPPSPWNTIVTWTESDESPFYCVEPWMGPPNAAEHQHGLHWVGPGESEVFSVRISL
ncbi:MAG: aldose epimerase [Opitutales bacterium]